MDTTHHLSGKAVVCSLAGMVLLFVAGIVIGSNDPSSVGWKPLAYIGLSVLAIGFLYVGTTEIYWSGWENHKKYLARLAGKKP